MPIGEKKQMQEAIDAACDKKIISSHNVIFKIIIVFNIFLVTL